LVNFFVFAEDGWVQVRSRSRFSPATKVESLDGNLSRSVTNLKPKSAVASARNFTRAKYQQPTSAKSMPSLVDPVQKPIHKKKPTPAPKNTTISTFESYLKKCNEKKVENESKLEENEVCGNDGKEEEKVKGLLSDQDSADDDEHKFDEEMRKNNEAEEMLQNEIKQLESADVSMGHCPTFCHLLTLVFDTTDFVG